MLRQLAQIILAIYLSAPKLPQARVEQLATAIQTQSQHVGIDPLIEVAIITHESQWNERAISSNGEDYGLMQVRARYYGGLAKSLLYGEHNIKVASHIIKLDIDLCRKYLHREPTTQEWLSCYQGSCTTKANLCKPTKLTKQVEDFAKCLEEISTGDAESAIGFDCRQIYWPK